MLKRTRRQLGNSTIIINNDHLFLKGWARRQGDRWLTDRKRRGETRKYSDVDGSTADERTDRQFDQHEKCRLYFIMLMILLGAGGGAC